MRNVFLAGFLVTQGLPLVKWGLVCSRASHVLLARMSTDDYRTIGIPWHTGMPRTTGERSMPTLADLQVMSTTMGSHSSRSNRPINLGASGMKPTSGVKPTLGAFSACQRQDQISRSKRSIELQASKSMLPPLPPPGVYKSRQQHSNDTAGAGGQSSVGHLRGCPRRRGVFRFIIEESHKSPLHPTFWGMKLHITTTKTGRRQSRQL